MFVLKEIKNYAVTFYTVSEEFNEYLSGFTIFMLLTKSEYEPRNANLY
jgi:hypothetical protein